MIFGNDRAALRAMYREAWQKRQEGAILEPLQAQIAEIVAMHPEYHALLEGKGDLDRDYSPEAGEANPFLHMGLHIAIHEQLATDRPAGIAATYQNLLQQIGDPHEVEHRIMDCLGEMIWQSQRYGQAPDEAAYLACVRKLGR